METTPLAKGRTSTSRTGARAMTTVDQSLVTSLPVVSCRPEASSPHAIKPPSRGQSKASTSTADTRFTPRDCDSLGADLPKSPGTLATAARLASQPAQLRALPRSYTKESVESDRSSHRSRRGSTPAGEQRLASQVAAKRILQDNSSLSRSGVLPPQLLVPSAMLAAPSGISTGRPMPGLTTKKQAIGTVPLQLPGSIQTPPGSASPGNRRHRTHRRATESPATASAPVAALMQRPVVQASYESDMSTASAPVAAVMQRPVVQASPSLPERPRGETYDFLDDANFGILSPRSD